MKTTRKRREPEHLTNTLVKNKESGEKYFDIYDDEQQGFFVRIMPSGAKTYYCRYTLPDGSQRSMRIGTAGAITAPGAREAAKKHWAAAVNGADPMAAKQAPKMHTLETFIDEAYKARSTHKSTSQTIAGAKSVFKELLGTRLDQIKPMWIENWKKSRLEAGRKKSTVNRDIDRLRGILSRAVDWGFIEAHPLRRVKKFKLDNATKPRFLNAEELKRLHAALEARELEMKAKRTRYNTWCKKRSKPTFPDLSALSFADYLRPMVLLALNSGMRRGEIFQLQWDDVVLDGNAPSLVIHGANAKGGRTRHIPLNAVALDTLTRWKAQTGTEGLVFKSPQGGGQFGHIRRAWLDLMKDAELPDFRFHDCRHHFASMLVQKGVDLNIVRELLGHADLALTMRYAHLAPHNAAAAVRLLDTPANVIPMKKENGR